jgi:hypothetical protein
MTTESRCAIVTGESSAGGRAWQGRAVPPPWTDLVIVDNFDAASDVRDLQRSLLKLGVFRLGLLEDWDVRVRILPQGKKILVSA